MSSMISLASANLLNFGLISEINLNQPDTWINKTFLTFDTDWANDEVLDDTINLVEAAGVKATWFITHDSKVIDRLKGNSNFELGIHPNFNDLLNGDTRNGLTADSILESLLKIVPKARCVRSHSLTQSERLLDLFAEKQLLHVSNTFIPASSQNSIKPWRLWSNLTIVPHFWQDNVAMRLSENDNLQELGLNQSLRVFDFHPIHVYLNTEDMNRYERARPFFHKPDKLHTYKNSDGLGVRTQLKSLFGAS